MTIRLVSALGLATLACAAGSASAETVGIAPIGLNQFLEANDPQFNNVWTGLAQSVTARDSSVRFGFYLANNLGPALERSNVTYTLREGDGITGRVLKQLVVSAVRADPDAPVLTMGDFSDIALTIGQRYTFTADVAFNLQVNEYSTARAVFGSLENGYADGRFYYIGSNYSDFYSDYDLAFRMEGASTAAIPEPSSWAMMIGGFGVAGTAMRRRVRTSARMVAA